MPFVCIACQSGYHADPAFSNSACKCACHEHTQPEIVSAGFVHSGLTNLQAMIGANN